MASKKRDCDTSQSKGSVSSEPPKKKQKTDSEGKDDMTEISVTLSTRLGQSQKRFDSNDLRQIDYFENLYSGRWNAEKSCTVENKHISCSVEEIDALIFYKKHNKINRQYPFSRVLYLCSASDYFAQRMDTKAFETYFAQRIPATTSQDLLDLKSRCDAIESCSNLSLAIDVTIKRMLDHKDRLNQQIIQNWSTVPIELIISNPHIAATVFTQNIKYVSSGRKKKFAFLARSQSASDLSTIWRYLCDHKAYLNDTGILESICGLTSPSSALLAGYGAYRDDIAKVVTHIVMDVLRLGLITRHEANYQMICNIFDMQRNQWGFDCANKVHNHHYFVHETLKTLLELRSVNEARYDTLFSSDTICKFVNEKMPLISKAVKPLDFIKDIEALNVDQRFKKPEQMAMLNVILDYHSRQKRITNEYKQKVQGVIKRLIQSDYNQSFKLTNKWFPVLMVDHKDWIIRDLPTKSSLESVETLISGICEYMTSKTYKASECDKVYFEFMNHYMQ
eukprot:119730_1